MTCTVPVIHAVITRLDSAPATPVMSTALSIAFETHRRNSSTFLYAVKCQASAYNISLDAAFEAAGGRTV